MQRVIIDFGTISLFGLSVSPRVFGYGLMLVCGFLLAIYLGRRRARRMGEDPDAISKCGLVALVAGVVGARLAYVIENWDHFAGAENPIAAVFDIRSGGLIYYGGLLLATIAVLVFFRLRRLPLRRYVDIVAVSVMVGLAFGRAGCLMNGCCWGARCDRSWTFATTFPTYSEPLLTLASLDNPYANSSAPAPLADAQLTDAVEDLEGLLGRSPTEIELAEALELPTGLVAPPEALLQRVEMRSPDPSAAVISSWRLKDATQLTESEIPLASAARSLPVKPAQLLGLINAVLVAGVLTVFHRMRRREGQVFALMLTVYPITRFVLESIRSDNNHDVLRGVLTHNQVTSMVMFLVGLALLVVIQRLPASAGPVLAQRLATARMPRRR